MPAIVGPIYIMSVTDNAAASFGDVFAISPKSVAHSGAGSGTFQLGERLMANSIRILQAEHRAVEDLGLIMAVCSNLCNRFTNKSKPSLPIKALYCQSKMRNWRKHAGSNAGKKSIHGGSPVHSATYFLSTNTVCGIGLTSSVNVKKK